MRFSLTSYTICSLAASYPGLWDYDARYHSRRSQAGGDVTETTDQSQSEGELTPTNHRAVHNIEGAVSGGLQMSVRSNATSEVG